MTKDKLLEIVSKLVQREVSRQMQNIKMQILSEMQNRPSIRNVSLPKKDLNDTPEKRFLSQIRPNTPKPRMEYSKNPFLNELLATTRPMESEGPPSHYTDRGFDLNEDNNPGPNIFIGNGQPITGTDGQLVNTNSQAVKEVLDIMNRDYSKIVNAKPVSNSKFKQLIENDDDEDLSFLNNIK